MRRSVASFFVVLAFLLTSTSSARAGVIHLSGTFAGSAGGPSDPVSGSYAAEFEDSVVTGVGVEAFSFGLTSLAMSPIGSTTFDAATAGGVIVYSAGTPIQIRIGGLINGVGVLQSFTDDFFFRYTVNGFPSFVLSSMVYTQPTAVYTASFDIEGATTFSNTPVPEPSVVVLLGAGLVGLAGLIAYRRRRR